MDKKFKQGYYPISSPVRDKLIQLVKAHRGDRKLIALKLGKTDVQIFKNINHIRYLMLTGKVEQDPHFLLASSLPTYWNKIEIQNFKRLVLEHDNDWHTISDKIVSRSAEECEQRARVEYKRLLNKQSELSAEE